MNSNLIREEDWDTNPIIDQYELESFLRSPFSEENYVQNSIFNGIPEPSHKGAHVYVENYFSKRFISLSRARKSGSLTQSSNKNSSQSHSQENHGGDSFKYLLGQEFGHSGSIPIKTNPSSEFIEIGPITMLRTIFQFFQGILAGISVGLMFIAYSNSSISNSLQLYYLQPYAQEIRRFLFLLTTVSAVGGIDSWMTLSSKAKNASQRSVQGDMISRIQSRSLQTQSRLCLFAACCYLLSFMCSLLMAQTDSLVSLRLSTSDPYYMTHPIPLSSPLLSSSSSSSSSASSTSTPSSSITFELAILLLENSYFSSSFIMWKSLMAIRCFFSIFGWICLSLLQAEELISLDQRILDLRTLFSFTQYFYQKHEYYQGNNLEKLTEKELIDLKEIQQTSLLRTESTLQLFMAASSSSNLFPSFHEEEEQEEDKIQEEEDK